MNVSRTNIYTEKHNSIPRAVPNALVFIGALIYLYTASRLLGYLRKGAIKNILTGLTIPLAILLLFPKKRTEVTKISDVENKGITQEKGNPDSISVSDSDSDSISLRGDSDSD